MAGIAAAASDNAIGVTGVAWDVPLLTCRVFNGSGGALISAIWQCVDLCTGVSKPGFLLWHSCWRASLGLCGAFDVHGQHVQAGAKVISMSLGGGYTAAYESMVRGMETAGVLLVAAAGNGEDQEGPLAACQHSRDWSVSWVPLLRRCSDPACPLLCRGNWL